MLFQCCGWVLLVVRHGAQQDLAFELHTVVSGGVTHLQRGAVFQFVLAGVQQGEQVHLRPAAKARRDGGLGGGAGGMLVLEQYIFKALCMANFDHRAGSESSACNGLRGHQNGFEAQAVEQFDGRFVRAGMTVDVQRTQRFQQGALQ